MADSWSTELSRLAPSLRPLTMFKPVVLGSCFAVLITAGAATSQEAVLDGLDTRPSGDAYAASIRFRGIQSTVGYYDPTRPPPPLETRETPQRDRAGDESGAAPGLEFGFRYGQETLIVVTSVVLLAIAYLFARHGGRLPVSFARGPSDGDARSGARRASPSRKDIPLPNSLEAIAAMPDRQAALIALCKSLLARVVTAQGVLMQRSWTDRDTLRRVPTGFAHRAALQDLVFASERVQFGGRNVSEAEFLAHLDQARPAWGASGA